MVGRTPHPWKFEDPEKNNPSRKGMLLSNEIQKFCEKGLLISDNFQTNNLRPAAYTLRVGRDYIDSKGKPGWLDEQENRYFEMDQNSIVYVSTYEKLDLPYYMVARFNLRVKWVYRGILLGTGPQVEPGYSGYLSCPLYNLTDRPIRIDYKKDFATIDFERTTDLCKSLTAEEIRKKIRKADEEKGENRDFDYVELDGEKYVLFSQEEYPPLKHLPPQAVLSSLAQLEQEVRTWRHIGIGIVLSFIALTLTLLGFGGNLYSQVTQHSMEVRQVNGRLEDTKQRLSQLESWVEELKAKLTERSARTTESQPKVRRPSR